MTTHYPVARCLLSGLSALLLCTLLGCQGLANQPANGTPAGNSLPTSVNHIIFLAQENRSLDHYFGAMRQYWADFGYPDQAFDGLPQFPMSSPSGAAPSNPGCNPAFAFPGNDCTMDASSPAVQSFHLITQCVENPSPSWNESHVDFNLSNPASSNPMLDGFVYTAAHDARTIQPPFHDVTGHRAMGYYDGSDLNYYYFMASNFATSDRWFSPVMTRTQPNRLFLLAATSAGHVYPPTATLSNQTIFGLLQNAGVSWKIYETDPGTTYLNNFQPFASQHSANVVPVSQYMTDVQNGTLPAVAMIEGGYNSGLDEHPKNNVQTGAAYVEGLINALMKSPSWKDSVFILTYDEAGGLYDHVPPMSTVSPDGIPPSDLQPGDICTGGSGGANCDFTVTGFRVPMIVISPFTKKNFVSHTPADYTAIAKLIETRFKLTPLTKRDAAQMDMTEFFDFKNVPWATPPSPPAQVTTGVCNAQMLQ